ncbi:MAG: aminomethyl-transferring glycine dehydrogenase subunit GcvPA [Oscillospiraceae bacterium]|jgi:glycine dehydrogenase subunit 1|nr:aminomethyl-transferring glycine dehydrogenase subunit GcvPA [Oscillospiraceae bacterium]
MGGYIPYPDEIRRAMLSEIGVKNIDALFDDIPADMRAGELDLPPGKSELETRRILADIAARNRVFPTIFRGGGAYRHYIPSIVKEIASRAAFLTAYTPYQAEASQGILQIIFEYQSEICALTGMDVSNASVYDGASAAAEAVAMCRERKRRRALLAGSARGDTLETIETYGRAANENCLRLPERGGLLDMDALRAALTVEDACLYIESPNRCGLIEDVAQAAEICRAAGVKLIQGCNPIALALLKTPAEQGADIAVGDGQPLGIPLGFGGPYLGFIACRSAMTRRLPGRIVGETRDADGKRAYVLTLQAREQHIRREKASSSICTNQALCALTATVYIAAMGPVGLADTARQCYAKAHYTADRLEEAGFKRRFTGEFFNEFITECPADFDVLERRFEDEGILGGLEMDGGVLWAVTEMNTREEIDKLARIAAGTGQESPIKAGVGRGQKAPPSFGAAGQSPALKEAAR